MVKSLLKMETSIVGRILVQMIKLIFTSLKLISMTSATPAAKLLSPTLLQRLLFDEAFTMARLHQQINYFEWSQKTIYTIDDREFKRSSRSYFLQFRQIDQPIKESFQMTSHIHFIQIEHLKVFNVPLIYATTMSHFTKIR